MGKIIFKELEKDDPIYSSGPLFSSQNSRTVQGKSSKPTPTPTDGQSMKDLTMPTEQSED